MRPQRKPDIANSGKYGKALVFNGANSMVTINNAASLRLTLG
jgi:hypothetical protein